MKCLTLKEISSLSKEGFKCVNFGEVLLELNSKIIEQVEFGGRSDKVLFEGEMISIPSAVEMMFKIGLKDIV